MWVGGKEVPLAMDIAGEHGDVFYLLLERGVDLYSLGTAEVCVRVAKEEGLVCILRLIEEQGVNVEAYECSNE